MTLGDVVHGGAIATLADLTVMAAAWCGVEAPPQLRGVTVSMALDFMAPARATDVIGVGRVLRRGLVAGQLRSRDRRPGGHIDRQGDRHIQGRLRVAERAAVAKIRPIFRKGFTLGERS